MNKKTYLIPSLTTSILTTCILTTTLLLLFSQVTFAESEDLNSFWFMSLNKFSIDKNYRAYIDLQPRFSIDAESENRDKDITQFIARGAFGYQVLPSLIFYQGYGIIPNYEPKKIEHRSYQELFSTHKYKTFTFNNRFRLEERFLEKIDNVALRARYFFRLTKKIKTLDKFSLALNEEAFFNLNDADSGPQRGFDQNRLFLGINTKVSKNLSFDIGYQNQYIEGRIGSNNKVNHILFLGIISNFNI